MMAYKASWRERRGPGPEEFGQTVYEGLFIETGTQFVVVADLSHGLRAMQVKSLDDYRFIENPTERVDLSDTDELTRKIFSALYADQALQTEKETFHRLIRK